MEEKSQLEKVIEHPYAKALLMVVVGFISASVTRANNTLDETSKSIQDLSRTVAAMSASNEERFTSQDRILNQTFNAFDKRITRLEDTNDGSRPQKKTSFEQIRAVLND